MSPSTLAALSLLMAINRLTVARPVSPNHRFTVYNPYWTQGSRSSLPYNRPDCIVTLCGERINPNPLPFMSKSDFDNVRTTKRSKNVYKTGWTMGGMPFSVLYMNPKAQVSVRSPTKDSLRSLPPAYDNSQLLLKEPPLPAEDRVEDYAPELLAQPLTSRLEGPAPTTLPTRKQYSIIPQLFVSYGWGPSGKK